MTSPDGAKAPSPDQGTLGSKQVKDLVENLQITMDGTTAKVTGSAKNIEEPWEDFDSNGDNTGHFVPVMFPAECVSKEVNLKGRQNGDRKVKVDPDRMLIVRLENLDAGNKLTVEMEERTVVVYDFSGVIKQ